MTTDLPILDRKPHFDERSRNFAVSSLFREEIRPRKRVWTARKTPLDQGSEGRCVVFGWGGELACTPYKYEVSDRWCNQEWPHVQLEDRKMGNNWADGASVLAGAKAMQTDKKVRYYAWAFGIDDVIQTLMRKGPVVLGINWYDSMYYTNKDGFVDVSGPLVGGHCILANGFIPNYQGVGDVVVWTNSWGPSYGVNGRGFIRVSDLDRLLQEDGEACIPTDLPVRA